MNNEVAGETDMSILIATYNRAEILRQTLANMINVDRTGIKTEIVIVDNNSSDDTKKVIESFTPYLPIRYIFEPRPGKNCALNKALNEVTLGELVVFTDDDVTPNPDWLQKIKQVSKRWKDICVFGGKVYPQWPISGCPYWIANQGRDFLSSAYALHDLGEKEGLYGALGEQRYPFGPNMWVRRCVFANGRTFPEDIGPNSVKSKRIIGSETAFLKALEKDGYKMLYSPYSAIAHRIPSEHVSKRYLVERAVYRGRCFVYFSEDFKFQKIYLNLFPLWLALRLCSLLKHIFRYCVSCFLYDKTYSLTVCINARRYIEYNLYYIKHHRNIAVTKGLHAGR